MKKQLFETMGNAELDLQAALAVIGITRDDVDGEAWIGVYELLPRYPWRESQPAAPLEIFPEVLTAWSTFCRARRRFYMTGEYEGHADSEFDPILELIFTKLPKSPAIQSGVARVRIAMNAARPGLGQLRETLYNEVNSLAATIASESAAILPALPSAGRVAVARAGKTGEGDKREAKPVDTVDLVEPTRAVSLTQAAKWFGQDKRTLRKSIDDGIVKAKQVSNKKWQFELGDIDVRHHKNADPEKYRA